VRGHVDPAECLKASAVVWRVSAIILPATGRRIDGIPPSGAEGPFINLVVAAVSFHVIDVNETCRLVC
jgi:hypothetical protein